MWSIPINYDDYPPSLKGASHEIELSQIRYQKKDLEKLELRGWVPTGTNARTHIYEQK